MRRNSGSGMENHCRPNTPPIPKAEASVKRWIWLFGTGWFWKNSTPFQDGRKVSHQVMSSFASDVRWMWWFSLETVVDRSIRRRKRQPGLTTFTAKERCPIRNSISLRTAIFVLPGGCEGDELLEFVEREVDDASGGGDLLAEEGDTRGWSADLVGS